MDVISGARDAFDSVRRRMGRRSLAILGRRDIGKTVLRELLLSASSDSVEHDEGLKPVVKLTVGGKSFEYEILADVPGDDSPSFKQWKRIFERSDRVIYIFRSDLIAEGSVTTVATVKSDIDRMRSWMDERGRSTRSVLLLGTWAGSRAASQDDSEKLRDRLVAIEPFKLGLVKLDNARLAVGDLIVNPDSVLDEVKRSLR